MSVSKFRRWRKRKEDSKNQQRRVKRKSRKKFKGGLGVGKLEKGKKRGGNNGHHEGRG